MRNHRHQRSATIVAATTLAVLSVGCSGTTRAALVGDPAVALPSTSVVHATGSTAGTETPSTVPNPPSTTESSGAPAPEPAPTISTSAVPAETTTTIQGRTGVFVSAAGTTAVVGSGSVHTYSVEVEEVLGLDPSEVAGVVELTLADPRSWIADGSVGFQRVTQGADIEIIVASPATVDSRCLPLNTIGQYSCRSNSSVNINSERWSGATSDWTLGIDAYRAYVINHEVGHALGHGHRSCPGAGQPAPLMMQQTKGLAGCVGNPWPFPTT